MSEFQYVGSELELFRHVRNWKSYWSAQVSRFIHGDVLEVGAGIGANTPFMDTGKARHWVCMEPDPNLVDQLAENLGRDSSRAYEAVCGTVRSLGDRMFDTIVYIDVLEHIEDDRTELSLAADRLKPEGRLIVVSPAHQRLFTPFDAAIGHFRRYDRRMLSAIAPASLPLERFRYLDSVGIALSTANRMLLQQSMPTLKQLMFWDRFVIPVSRVMDPILGYALGKTVLAVWRKPQHG